MELSLSTSKRLQSTLKCSLTKVVRDPSLSTKSSFGCSAPRVFSIPCVAKVHVCRNHLLQAHPNHQDSPKRHAPMWDAGFHVGNPRRRSLEHPFGVRRLLCVHSLPPIVRVPGYMGSTIIITTINDSPIQEQVLKVCSKKVSHPIC